MGGKTSQSYYGIHRKFYASEIECLGGRVMKVSCIDNLGVECLLTQGKVYEATNSELDCNYFVVTDDSMCANFYLKERFEVIPSIDDVIKDKEREKRTMNGLEAIELMKQGKMIKCGIWIYSTDSDGVIWLKNKSCTGWVEAEMFNILANDYEEYIEPKPLTGWERVEYGGKYFVICGSGDNYYNTETRNNVDNTIFNKSNYFSTKEKVEEIDFKQTLFRKLQRFSDENGGNEIDLNDRRGEKWCIRYDNYKGEPHCEYRIYTRDFGQVYFISKEVAEKAIELFHDDLIKYFTGDFGGDK